MMFDFAKALQDLDPRFDWDITPLSGGLVNSTVRASKKDTPLQGSSDPATGSVVLDLSPYATLVAKYAPPYVASLGPDAPFSQFRQTIEARALQLLSSVSILHAKIPKLIHHDSKLHLLLMEDLGPLSNLQEFLLDETASENENATTIATKLGQALAHLHNTPLNPNLSKSFENPDMYLVVFESAVAGIEGKLSQFSIEHAIHLGQRCAESFRIAKGLMQEGTPFLVFSMGDMWPPSILIDEGSKSSSNPISLIDWEFAGPALPFQDIAQLTAHLEIYKMTNPSIEGLRSFSKTLAESYTTESRKIGMTWLTVDTSSTSNSSEYIGLLRHAIILHGRELINVGVEKDWGSKGASTSDIVNKGAVYLRLAGESPQDIDLTSLEKDEVFGPLFRLLLPPAVSS